MKKSTTISKPDIMTCWKCCGQGHSGIKICSLCNGTGLWTENHYIVIDNKNKIAIDSDSGG